MSREVKRVKANFEWPLNQIWPGFLISTCIDDCDSCQIFAKLKGMEFTNHNCPKFPDFGPPKGEWYQVWETTSEGSPISPAFETPEELAEWLEVNKASSFGSSACSYDQWLEFIKGPGYAPSMILDNKGLHSGVCASEDKQKETNYADK